MFFKTKLHRFIFNNFIVHDNPKLNNEKDNLKSEEILEL